MRARSGGTGQNGNGINVFRAGGVSVVDALRTGAEIDLSQYADADWLSERYRELKAAA